MTTSSSIPAASSGGTPQTSPQKRTALRSLAGVKSKPVRRRRAGDTDTIKVSLDSVDRMLGHTTHVLEDDEGGSRSIIPDDATPIDASQLGAEASLSAQVDMPPQDDFIPTSAALVAPDVTPNLRIPLEPSLAPAAQSPAPTAVDTILARPSQPTPAPATQTAHAPNVESMLRMMGVSPEAAPVPAPLGEGASAASAPSAPYDAVAASMTPGIPMPEHRHDPESARKLFEATRSFIKVS